MTTQPDYLKYLESAKLAELADQLRESGHQVEVDKHVGKEVFALAATKNGRTTVYEFKAPRHRRYTKEQLTKLQGAAAEAGYTFRIVVPVPPPRVSVEIDRLTEHLTDYLMEHIPSELDSLSSQTRIEGVSDVETAAIRIGQGTIRVSGTASVNVELWYGGSSDGGPPLHDSYPLHFKVRLDSDGSLAEVEELTVDTSSFYE